MEASQTSGGPRLVSFSGIDGAGKSTQIDALREHLTREQGMDVRTVRFWDDIATLKRVRQDAGHHLFHGDKGVGSPSRPINRKDKNIQTGPMTVVRLIIYFFDALALRRTVKRALSTSADLIIFDRYMYDELANLPLHAPAVRTYVRLLMKMVPRPHISFLLDADPEKARARKPEYPLEFLHTNRQAYLALAILIGGITVISPAPLADMKRAVISHALVGMHLASSRNHDRATGENEFSPSPARG